MENGEIIFIDSNYWIYLFDSSTSEHTQVKHHFEEVYGNYKLAVNYFVMIEVMHYLVKRLGPKLAKDKWDLFSSMDLLIDDLSFIDLDLIFNELSTYSHTGIGGRDATILSSMRKLRTTNICTHDKNFLYISEIRVIDPILETNEQS